MKAKDALFNSLQDSEDKLYGFLDWLLDAIAVHNSNSHLKPITAPSQQLEHAVQALRCVKKCHMDIAGQADGWNPKSDMLKGPFIWAKHMQADLATCTGSLNSRHVTVTQYRDHPIVSTRNMATTIASAFASASASASTSGNAAFIVKNYRHIRSHSIWPASCGPEGSSNRSVRFAALCGGLTSMRVGHSRPPWSML